MITLINTGYRHILCCVILTILFAANGRAEVRLPRIFGSGMVVQRNEPVVVWGWADAGEKITVRLAGQVQKTTADATGNWQLRFRPLKAGGPYRMDVTGNNTIRLEDILSGDVWLCSGQSNMELEVKYAQHAAAEIAASGSPLIRHVKVPVSMAINEQEDLAAPCSWQTAGPGNVADFSAVGYFFARRLVTDLKVPIGIINASKGATTIEPWLSQPALESVPELKQVAALIPRVSLEVCQDQRKEAVLSRVHAVQPAVPDTEIIKQFSTPEFDHRRWPQMDLPSIWEQHQLQNLDGVVWFRRQVDLDASFISGDSVLLKFGFVDDNDQCYVNGVLVGASRTPQAARVYRVPPGILKTGTNVIAVRVEDTGGNGGFYGTAGDFVLQVKNKVQPLSGKWHYQVSEVYPSSWEIEPNTFPALLFNSMIGPLTRFPVAGILWYQGEGNAGGARRYQTSFPLLIKDWRKRWKKDLPFYFVQLSGFEATGRTTNSNTGSLWAELREAQAAALALPRTGMAVTTDIGNPVNIHPENKQEVGRRLAALALNQVYKKNVACMGPVFKTAVVEGNRIRVVFDAAGNGLQPAKAGDQVTGFEVAGGDGTFYKATVRVAGTQLWVAAPEVKAPVVVRYNWADYTQGNLFNSEGFPAAPFRSDAPQYETGR